MKRKEKIAAAWTALTGLMLQENFEPKKLLLVGHNKAIAFVNGIPTYKEMEAPDFDFCKWLINGHIDTTVATTLDELDEVLKNTRTIICDDVDDNAAIWIVRVTKFRAGNPKVKKYKYNSDLQYFSINRRTHLPADLVDEFTLYKCV